MSASCPNCGAELTDPPRSARLHACAYCQTTLIVNKGDISAEGTSGQIHSGEALLRVGDHFKLAMASFMVQGRAQYSYGRGFWDEYWISAEAGSEDDQTIYWLSIDEGDVVIQKVLSGDGLQVQRNNTHDWVSSTGIKPLDGETARFLATGDRLYHEDNEFIVTEVEQATCLGFEGSWPEPISIGQTYRYLNAEAQGGLLLSCEIDDVSDTDPDWFIGRWYSPFDIRRLG